MIFGAFYLLMIKPATEALESAKISALGTVAELCALGTPQGISDASRLAVRIQEAASRTEIHAILTEVEAAISREEKRLELLDLVELACSGTFYSGESEEGKILLPQLTDLKATLVSEIEGKQTLSQLEAYESQLDVEATTAWRTALASVVEAIGDNIMYLERMNSLPYSERMNKENALQYLENYTWRELRKVRFVEATVLVPVLDVLKRAPTVGEGDTVKVYVYDIPNQKLELLTPNAVIKHVLYRDTDMVVAGTSLWENIKNWAAVAAAGATPPFEDFGEEAVKAAIRANILSYDIWVLHVIEVSDLVGEQIVQFEFHQPAAKDVILIPVV